MRRRFFILLGVVFLAAAGAALLIVLAQDRDGSKWMYDRVEDVPARTWAIVLGAKVWGLEPSPMLEDRLVTAAQLFKSGKVRRLFLSGGLSQDGPDEVVLMADWLVGHGVPRGALVQDPAGLRTMASMLNARNQIDASNPVIVTQRFHLPRALYLAQQVGFDAIGVVADQRTYQDELFYRLREVFAQLKAVYDQVEPMVVDRIRGYPSPADDKQAAIEAGRSRIQGAFAERGLSYPPSRVYLVYVKTKRSLELYVDQADAADHAQRRFFRSYPVLAASGTWGPKLRESDRQVPEGLYRIEALNKRSHFHLALRLSYPNEYDGPQGPVIFLPDLRKSDAPKLVVGPVDMWAA